MGKHWKDVKAEIEAENDRIWFDGIYNYVKDGSLPQWCRYTGADIR